MGKARHHISNWRQYKRTLIHRVSLTFRVGEQASEQWYYHATPTHQTIKQQVPQADVIHEDGPRHQRGGERHWMWLALSKVAVCFMTAYYGRGQDAAKRLLGLAPEGVVVTGYSSRMTRCCGASLIPSS